MGALTRTSTAQSARNLLVLTGASEVRQKCREFAPGCEVDRTSTWGTRGRRPLHRAPGSCACKGSRRKQSCHPGACTQGVGPFPVSTVYSVPRVELASNEHSVTIGTSLSKHGIFIKIQGIFQSWPPLPALHPTALPAHVLFHSGHRGLGRG